MACSDQISALALEKAALDAVTVAEVANSRAGGEVGGALIDSTTTRLGDTASTLRGQLDKLGYKAPIAYASSIVFTVDDGVKTIEESGLIYAPLISALPFTTSGTFVGDDDARFRLKDGSDPQTATNTAGIAANTADIATNTAGIAANTANIALKANLAGAAFAGAVSVAGALSSTAGNVNLKSNTALSDAAATLTAAQLIGGEFTITPTVARIQTTDTAANIIAALTGSVDNSNFETTIVNLAAFDVTLAAGTGVTLVGNMTVNNGSATFRVRRLTSSTVSITRLETGSGPLIYTSPDQIITVGGTLTLTHGLGVRPTDIKAQLICAVANNNYPIGAVLPISTGYQGDNFDLNRTMSVWTENDTEIDISFGSTSNTFIIIHATSGARVLITNTDWRLRIIAKEY